MTAVSPVLDHLCSPAGIRQCRGYSWLQCRHRLCTSGEEADSDPSIHIFDIHIIVPRRSHPGPIHRSTSDARVSSLTVVAAPPTSTTKKPHEGPGAGSRPSLLYNQVCYDTVAVSLTVVPAPALYDWEGAGSISSIHIFDSYHNMPRALMRPIPIPSPSTMCGYQPLYWPHWPCQRHGMPVLAMHNN